MTFAKRVQKNDRDDLWYVAYICMNAFYTSEKYWLPVIALGLLGMGYSLFNATPAAVPHTTITAEALEIQPYILVSLDTRNTTLDGNNYALDASDTAVVTFIPRAEAVPQVAPVVVEKSGLELAADIGRALILDEIGSFVQRAQLVNEVRVHLAQE